MYLASGQNGLWEKIFESDGFKPDLIWSDLTWSHKLLIRVYVSLLDLHAVGLKILSPIIWKGHLGWLTSKKKDGMVCLMALSFRQKEDLKVELVDGGRHDCSWHFIVCLADELLLPSSNKKLPTTLFRPKCLLYQCPYNQPSCLLCGGCKYENLNNEKVI